MAEAAAPKDYDFKTGGAALKSWAAVDMRMLVKPLPETSGNKALLVQNIPKNSPEIDGFPPNLEVYGIGFATGNPKMSGFAVQIFPGRAVQ